MYTKTLFTAASLLAAANAHLFIQSPTPIPGNGVKPPLDPSGSDFPCHGVSLPTTGGQVMPAGSSQLLEFDDGGGANTATHGGGSCQISITYETDADKVKDPANWYVIYSIEGGCPVTAHGNLAVSKQCTGPDQTECLNQFNFTIPKGVKDGHAILAWTWFNTIGNREMYMDCVNTQLTGGDGSEMASFPSMFVANLADVNAGCATEENTYVGFPDPGPYVTTVIPANAPSSEVYPIKTATAAACQGRAGGSAPASPTGGSGSGSGTGSGSGGSGGNGSPAASPSYNPNGRGPGAGGAAASPSPTATGGSSGGAGGALGPVTMTTLVTVTGTAPSGGSGAAAPTGGPASGSSGSGSGSGSGAAASPSGGAAAGSSSSSTTSSGTCASGSVSCSNAGGVVCIGSGQFGLCDTNGCAVAQALAAGTTCANGVIARRGVLDGWLWY